MENFLNNPSGGGAQQVIHNTYEIAGGAAYTLYYAGKLKGDGDDAIKWSFSKDDGKDAPPFRVLFGGKLIGMTLNAAENGSDENSIVSVEINGAPHATATVSLPPLATSAKQYFFPPVELSEDDTVRLITTAGDGDAKDVTAALYYSVETP